MARCTALLSLLFLLLASPAPAATGCAAAILRDWSEDGRVGRSYSPPCYEQAIDALPPDIRDYTNAEDVITRALASAVRSSGQGKAQQQTQPAVEPASQQVPLALWAVGGLAVAVVSAGALAYALRRRRSDLDTG